MCSMSIMRKNHLSQNVRNNPNLEKGNKIQADKMNMFTSLQSMCYLFPRPGINHNDSSKPI